jgi:hypothetical protein
MSLEQYVDASTWPTDLAEAKEYGKTAVNQFKWKEKVPTFLDQIDKASSVKRVQEIVIYPLLSGEGLGVVK